MSHVSPARLVALGTAEMLAELSCEVEGLGTALCSDAELAGRHMASLQAIDLLAQKLCGLAELLAADCPATGLARLRLDCLRDRFSHLDIYTTPAPQQQPDETIWN